MEKIDFQKFMELSRPEPWTNCYNYVEDALEKIHKLERVSGHNMDTLISLFAAGWKLKAPEFKYPLSPLLDPDYSIDGALMRKED